ncbi:MAG: hypothetical protein IT518_21015 [Burkholderiales bacterium]|nr:hypothetical protein [Burkholderiales bacterium]
MPSLWRLSIHGRLATLCLGAGFLLVNPGPATGEAPPPSGVLTGTIAIHGCSVAASDVLLRARPITTVRATYARTLMTQALRAPSAAAGQFTFAFAGLAAGVPYRIGVKLVGQSQTRCPRLAWDVDREPLVIGGDLPLAFDGYAGLSELEILGAAVGRDRETWVGADAVDFADPSIATRQLRWRTSVPGATGGELQISRVPFPRIGSRAGPCSEDDSAIVARVPFAAVPGVWTMPAPVDFHDLVYGGRSVAGRSSVDSSTIAKLEAGMPLYLRVVPTDADGPICDPDTAGVPAGVRVAKVLAALLESPQPPSPRLEVDKVYYSLPVIGKHPYDGETCYRVTQRHVIPSQFVISGWSSWELLATKVVQHQGGVFPWFVPDGARFCVCNNCGDDDGWFESFTDTFGSIVTGLVDAVAKLVNAASAAWEDIQDYAVSAVADGINAMAPGLCDSTCRAALETGLEVGLATMGVPPSLPNFDQMVDGGFDYLAAQAMSQAGVPGVIADYAEDELSAQAQKFMKEAIASMKETPYAMDKLPNWLVPDLQFERAVLTVDLWGPGVAANEAFANAPALMLKHDDVYVGGFYKLPRKIPKKSSGKPLRFPIVLEPNLSGLPSAPANYDAYNTARVDKQRWVAQRYTKGCYNIWIIALLSNPAEVNKLFSAKIRADALPVKGCAGTSTN